MYADVSCADVLAFGLSGPRKARLNRVSCLSSALKRKRASQPSLSWNDLQMIAASRAPFVTGS
jgi:hypothetical protein